MPFLKKNTNMKYHYVTKYVIFWFRWNQVSSNLTTLIIYHWLEHNCCMIRKHHRTWEGKTWSVTSKRPNLFLTTCVQNRFNYSIVICNECENWDHSYCVLLYLKNLATIKLMEECLCISSQSFVIIMAQISTLSWVMFIKKKLNCN